MLLRDSTLPSGWRVLTGDPLSNLLHVLEIIQNWVTANLDPLWPDEYAPLDLRILAPVSGASHASIVLADWFIQLDAYPSTDTRDLFDVTHVLDLSPSGVVFADPASLPNGDPTGFDFLRNGGNLGLLKAGSIGVEAAELLSLLPGKDRVRLLLVLFLRQHVFLDTSRAREIGSRRNRPCVNDLVFKVSWISFTRRMAQSKTSVSRASALTYLEFGIRREWKLLQKN